VTGTMPRFFFMHIMKTGGATFRQYVYANFEPGAVYPDKHYDSDMRRANTRIDYLLGIAPARREMIRAYTGHFPFVASEMLGIDFVRLTIVRDPVERTISYLKHCKRYHEQHRDMALERIYEDPFFFPCLIHNHETKVFSMGPGDKLESYMDVIEMDDRRLGVAQANLEKIDVLGLTSHHGEFLEELNTRFGWVFDGRPNLRVGDEPSDVSPAFRRRIADDNAADVAFYEFATRLYRRRRRTRISA
jgi:hypothetical protein